MASRNPLPFLLAAALVPAAALGGLTAVARGRADQPPPPPTTITPVLPPALDAPLLSVRRAPTPLADDVREDTLFLAAAPLLSYPDGSSCVGLAADGRPLAGTNLSLAVIPASTLKVITTAVALDVLGPEYVFTTEVRGPAPAAGVVAGDLVLVGSGDPVLSEAWYATPTAARKRPPNTTTSMEALADAVVAAGVTSVTGRVVGDDGRYDEERYPAGWSADLRGTIDFPPISALTVNDTTSRNDTVGADPALNAASVLDQLLRQRGVSVGGEPSTSRGAGAAAGAPIAAVQSAPLATLVHELLSTSDNGAAELLVKEIGVAVAGQGTRPAGLQAITDRLLAWGVPLDGVSLTDGSGLSRDNQVTCGTLLAVLRRAPMGDVLGQGMAVAGEDGTTLAGQLESAGIEGVLRAKTGSLTGVKALAGYFPAGDQEVAFVLILNGPSATDYATAWAALADALLAAAATPSADALAVG
ncbi:MAG: D-alanyl-D-alanine carboxypeptidase/D-alanyl-D-alanine-endopeptidase [Acidimicrobiaceae bacterium]|nr:D-alanyl-D-alanine carboxypeptidase/D-alanyl-D-alanine-endopeptidase [Ilumatobacter sp.]MCB9380415.1 D-alanyl-D-alanine carboxypeptidase/D-alanyl-D-alanine-endopeptidase [Acidimicrobiaceae bacterium]MCO5330838.1 D-alanyl-D-alanine carboxypeptidase/D-alanyl-D-alanine-endopeptidase [Ilumatobacteraceae bacterium]